VNAKGFFAYAARCATREAGLHAVDISTPIGDIARLRAGSSQHRHAAGGEFDSTNTMRTIPFDKMLEALHQAGIPAEAIHPCDTQVSLFKSSWVKQVFVPFALAELEKDGLIPMRVNIADCEDEAMAVRHYAVKLHRRDPQDSVTEDPTGVNATGIAVGFLFIPGHSINVIITSDAPKEVTVRFYDFTLGGKEIEPTKETLDLCKLCVI